MAETKKTYQRSYDEYQRVNEPHAVTDSVSTIFTAMPPSLKRSIGLERYITKIQNQFRSVAPEAILRHVNSIYLLFDDQGDLQKPTDANNLEQVKEAQLIVYVDSSIAKAELNVRRELIRMKYRELFSIHIYDFVIRISRKEYLNNYPFRESADTSSTNTDETPTQHEWRLYNAELKQALDPTGESSAPDAKELSRSTNKTAITRNLNNQNVSRETTPSPTLDDSINALEDGPLKESFKRILKPENTTSQNS